MIGCFSSYANEFTPVSLAPEEEERWNQKWFYSFMVNNVRDHVEIEGAE